MAEVAEVRGRRREQRGWYFYDWANSAFSTTVATVFLGPYLTSVTEKAADARGFVHPLGIAVRDGSFFPYDVSLSVFLTVFVLPVVGAIADRTQRKKQMLATFAYLGAFATMGLFFVSGGRYLLGGALFIVANVSFGAAAVVYNAYLPEIAEPDERDAVSARGWAMGYLGGGLLLAANLVLFNAHARLDVSEGEAVRICLLSAGIWWAAWTVIPLRRLRRHRPAPALPESGSVVTAGFRQLRETFREARNYPLTLAFLLAYLIYNDGIQTVITLASVYGDKELDLPTSTLITAILVVQFVAFGGALLFGRLARAYGARNAVLFSLVLWTIAVALAFVLPARRALLFFSLAILIGVVLGGSQALSRSMFSQLIPVGREAAYFSLYEISERGTSWLGPLVFGVTYQATGSYRSAIISLIVFFAVGGVLLARVNLRRAIEAAGNRVPERV
ncbi:MAG: MFS transporter [Actinomycetota bacterium]|nr:MFS transporter [Actinomycetota bacterium]